jgi:hypothetical protein
MAEDKYLLEDGSGGYQLEDASGVLLIDYPQADATLGGVTGQLYPRPVVQYQAMAAPMVAGSGVSWMPRLPEPVQRAVVGLSMVVVPLLPQPAAQTWVHPQTPALVQAVVPYRSVVAAPLVAGLSWTQIQPPEAARLAPVQPSVVAAPLTIPSAPGVNWIFPRQPDLVRLPTRADSVLVQPPSVTASLPQNVTWWPQFPDRVVQRVRFQEPLTVGPPVSPTLPSAADAGIQGSGGQLYPRPVVQYQAIAGPVLIPAAAAPSLPLQFNADGLIRPDSWTHNQAVAGPVAIPITVGWWPRLPDTVQVPVRPVFSFYSNPIQPLNPAALSALPWLMRNQPLILPQYPIRHVLALNPTTPAAPLIHGWWLRQPDLVRLLRENPHVRAVPIQPLNPAGRSDLPWLPQAPPGIAKPIAAPSSLAFPPPAALLGSVGVATWIIIVPSWPDTVVVEAHADVIIVPASPNDVDVP